MTDPSEADMAEEIEDPMGVLPIMFLKEEAGKRDHPDSNIL